MANPGLGGAEAERRAARQIAKTEKLKTVHAQSVDDDGLGVERRELLAMLGAVADEDEERGLRRHRHPNRTFPSC